MYTALTQDCERLVVELLLQGYLAESYRAYTLLTTEATAYTVHVYVVPGGKARSLSHLSLAEATSLTDAVSLVLQAPTSKKQKS